MPHNALNNATDKLIALPSDKLVLKILLVISIGAIVVGSILFGVIRELYEKQITELRQQGEYDRKRAEKAEALFLETKEQQVNDLRQWTGKLETIDKKLEK